MNHSLQKLMLKKKKEGKTLDKNHATAKSNVLGDLMDDMFAEGADKVKGIKKVTVAGSDPQAIEQGLDKAKEIVEGMEDVEKDEMLSDVSEGEEESEEDEIAQMSEEEIKEQIRMLQEALMQKKA